ncbi:MAG: rhomboid family intramembrane serine protease [Candidatus Aenigmatarchaeota archaeon]|nr:MAG: rhomboid family intramembrane serine protease [Candidatus Aenigmarchaeota archaeon]
MRVTYTLIAINIVVFILQNIFYSIFMDVFALTPVQAVQGWYWQFLTYMFLHGGLMHITINMFVLFMFGTVVEYALGARRFITLYLVSGVGSAVFYILLMGVSNVPMIGASGAVFGIMAAYGLMFPKNVIFIPPGIPLPAISAVFLLAFIELFLGLTGLEPGIANFGHLGGIVTGFLLVLYWKHKTKPKTVHELRNFEFFWE